MKTRILHTLAVAVPLSLILTGCAQDGQQAADNTSSMALTPQEETTTVVTPSPDTSPTQETTTHSETVTESSTADAAPSTSPTAAEGVTMMGAASTDPTSFTEPDLAELVITDIRAGSHEGFDRVVFEFQGSGTPGFHAGYTDQPRQQASGRELDVAGAQGLEIMIHGTPMGLGGDNPLTHVGPVDAAAGNVQGITSGGVFEADSQYIIGVDQVRPYSVTVLDNPARVVVDIQQ